MINMLTANEVAAKLGVELATVYAYASRGSLTRHVGPDGRTSRYDADEVEALAQRSRPRSARRGIGAIDVTIGTTISEIGDGWIRYRGHDVLDLAGSVPFESVARLLWTGELDGGGPDPSRAVGHRSAVDAAVAATRRLGDVPVWARLAVGVAAAAPDLDRSTPHAGFGLLDVMVASLPDVGEPTPGGASIAARLWPKLSPLVATRRRIAAVDRALTLLAEHELATSTLGARVAASTGASPAACVLAALGVLSGPLHGGAPVLVQQRLESGGPPTADGAGFGHSVHRHGDPRVVLLDDVLELASPRRRQVILDDLAAHRAAGALAPNSDAALGALGYVGSFPEGAIASVFAIARGAGWVAHAFEEADETPLRYRGRTVFRGGGALTRSS